MMKTRCTLAFLLLAILANSQNSTLIKNRNFRATELKHDLNSNGDSLILEGLRNIIKVVISNDSFTRTIPVVKKKINISLAGIPVGRFTTEVQLDNKLIIITLLRHKTIEATSNALVGLSNKPSIKTDLRPPHRVANISSLDSETDLNENAGLTTDEGLNTNEGLTKNEDSNEIEDSDKNKVREVRFYWIENYINKAQSSRKLMKIADLETVKRFIRKHEIDHRTKSGRNNELTIWEVYDTSKFMKFKRMNPDYASAKSSDCFNTTPFYQLLSQEKSK